ncbi:MAG: hypothetical protein M1830_001526 [Pleopsidium flavum]|nr:MAG: hypothetical protein M1830_001526 [Pleopsidium flavum]
MQVADVMEAGDAALGDSSKPTYTVAIADTEAAANRDAFAAKKEAKRLVPSKKPDEPKTEDNTGKSTGSNPFDNSKGTLRGRSNTRTTTAATTETAAVETLNTRPPAIDPARDVGDWDHYRDNSTSSNSTLGDRPSSEARRGNDIEEVRGLLKRESTRGRRKPVPTASAVPGVATIVEPASNTNVEYNDYALQGSVGGQESGYQYQQRAPQYQTAMQAQQVRPMQSANTYGTQQQQQQQQQMYRP